MPRRLAIADPALPLEEILPILEAIAAEPSLSQRELARRAGLSLGKANFVLRRLAEKGLIKVHNAARSSHKLGYLYLLTPQGLETKARLTYRFMHGMAERYRAMVDRVDVAVARAVAEVDACAVAVTATAGGNGAPPRPKGPVCVAILGEGPLAEVIRDVVTLREDVVLAATFEAADCVVVADPDAERPAGNGVHYVHLA